MAEQTTTTTTNNQVKEVKPQEIKREFILNKNVTAEAVQPIIEGINAVNKYDAEQEAKNPNYVRKPIKLIVDSYGGSIYCGKALVHTIDTSETPVHGYCLGKAMSMGFAIFVACHKRFAHKNATFMYHDGGTTDKGTIEEIQIGIDQLKKVIKVLDEMIVEYTNIKMTKLNAVKKSRKNWYIFGKDAVELGIVDELLESTREKHRKNA